MKKTFMSNNNWVGGISDGLVSKCQCCGHIPYIDYTVTDDFWNEVVPPKMKLCVICLKCLDEIATEKGKDISEYLLRVQFTGKMKTIEMKPDAVFYYS